MHNDSSIIENIKFVERCKERALVDIETPLRLIYEQEAENSPVVPTTSFVNIQSTLERIRSSVLPPIPTSIETVAASIENSPFHEIGGKSFYQGEVVFGRDRAFILTHADHIARLGTFRNWYADGTFQIRPLRNLFAQVTHLTFFIY